MKLRFYINGNGEGYGTHLSIFLVILKGDYDALLDWPFEQKVYPLHNHIVHGYIKSDYFVNKLSLIPILNHSLIKNNLFSMAQLTPS